MTKLPKIVFLDTEFTGEHAKATLVSLGLVTITGEELYVTLNDYDRRQVTDWLSENVLSYIDASKSVTSHRAYMEVDKFLREYSDGSPVYIISCGLLQDYILLLELYRFSCPEREFFHALHCLPDYLNHHAGIDLNTILRLVGIDPSLDKLEFLGENSTKLKRHIALDDAKIVRKIFLKIQEHSAVQNLINGMRF